MGVKVIGASRLRRKLLRLPVEIQGELRKVIAEQATLVQTEMKSRAPVGLATLVWGADGKPREHLRDAIEVVIAKNGLKARIGLISRRARKVFFFARFLEFGFKHRGGSFIKRPFLFPAWIARREGVRTAVKEATVKALHAVAARPMSDV